MSVGLSRIKVALAVMSNAELHALMFGTCWKAPSDIARMRLDCDARYFAPHAPSVEFQHQETQRPAR